MRKAPAPFPLGPRFRGDDKFFDDEPLGKFAHPDTDPELDPNLLTLSLCRSPVFERGTAEPQPSFGGKQQQVRGSGLLHPGWLRLSYDKTVLPSCR